MSTSSRTPTEFLPFPVCGDCGLDFDGDQHRPLLLRCQHAFGKSCLSAQEDNDDQNCPTCKESWVNSNVTQLSVVYDLIPPEEDGTGREVMPDGRNGRGATGREVTPAETDRRKTQKNTGREVTPVFDKRGSASGQEKSLSSARFPVCIICSEDFNINSQRPLKLPCGHCFCRSCLEVLRNTAKSSCPKCRSEWITTELDRLPIVRSLIHPSNRDKNVPREPFVPGNGKSIDDIVKTAESLYSGNKTQTQQQRNTKSEIYVKDTQNRNHAIQVDLQRGTVLQLRTLVTRVTGVQPAEQRLLYNSRQLEDGYTLAHYGIKAYDTIVQTCRLRGGAV